MFESFIIYTTNEYFYIQPVNTNSDELMLIDRIINECKMTNLTALGSMPTESQRKSIYGIVGTIKLLSGYYLIVITSKTKVGVMNGHDVWKADKFEMLSYHNNENHLNEEEKKFNSQYKSMVESILASENFYYSYNYDLTHTLQRLQEANLADYSTAPTHERVNLGKYVDDRFVWNYYLLQNLNATNSDFSKFLLPIMLGFISINQVEINGKTFQFSLISRRSCLNAGTRFNIRGADDNGNVANFVETEQLVTYNSITCSYVQIRGSIPMFWSQKPNIKYKPSIKINDSKNHMEACVKHFNKLLSVYGKQVCVNLINHHGSEGNLEKKYADILKSLNDSSVKYESFDFHKQCSKERYDRLSILINRLANDQDAFGYYAMDRERGVSQSQKGVFRVNCIDCLDRTNVVQGLLAKRMLLIQLIQLNILNESESIESHEKFYNIFRNVWADNGDRLSVQYAGTGALKSDFTRTGKRTAYGLMRDGTNSLYRYFLNNFYDGFKQDAIDLFLGNYRISASEITSIKHCPIAVDTDKRFLMLPVVGLGTLSMFFISILIPAETYQEQLIYVVLWGFATFLTFGLMFKYGSEIVDMPKLVHKKNK